MRSALRRLRGARRYGVNPLWPPRIVLAAGMNRSGSTLLYNAARLMLTEQAPGEVSCGWVEDWPTLERRRRMLVKLHDFDAGLAALADTVFYSFRDVRDVLASSQRIWKIAPSLEAAAYHIAQYRAWTQVADLSLRYETLMADTEAALARLAEVIGVAGADVAAIAAALDAMSFDKARDASLPYDATNLMHRGHRTDGRHGSWVGVIEPDLLRAIEDTHRDWFVQHGYPLENA